MTPGDVVAIIGAVAAAAVTIIAALGRELRQRTRVVEGKLDEIHELTNGGLDLLRAEVAAANRHIEEQRALITRLERRLAERRREQ